MLKKHIINTIQTSNRSFASTKLSKNQSGINKDRLYTHNITLTFNVLALVGSGD